jgi:alpha 1,2-mannosyltransferase
MQTIITVAGGRHYGCNAYASIRLLRYLGCELPIEWYYLTDEEMPTKWIQAVEAIPNTKCFNLNCGDKDNRKARGGWQSKIKAILKSEAVEVLFMDADNFIRRDPTYLFETELYQEHGAVLWPDIYDWEKQRYEGLKNYFGVCPQHKHQAESGQLLFNKNKCIKALEQTVQYNLDSEHAYKVVYGDKDTFYFGFIATDTPFNFIPKRPACGYGCLQQYDPYDKILFTHLTGGKFALHGREFTTKDSLPHIDKCKEFLGELREQLV